jgi:tol-pal system protein YbgF
METTMRLVLVACLALSTLACTSGEDLALLHREITDVQREVQDLKVSTLDRSDLQEMEQTMVELTEQTRRSNADLAMRVSQLQDRLEAVHSSLELTTRRLQDISQELAAARASSIAVIPPVTATPSGSGPSAGAATVEGGGTPVPVTPAASAASPDELYRSAYQDYLQGNYDLAAQGFREYLRRFPDTELSDNALYWIGECYDAQDLTQEALEVFTQVLTDHPTSDKAAAAQLKKGLLYLKDGDQGQGVVHLQYVVYEHPGTEEAELAREKLRGLGLNIR